MNKQNGNGQNWPSCHRHCFRMESWQVHFPQQPEISGKEQVTPNTSEVVSGSGQYHLNWLPPNIYTLKPSKKESLSQFIKLTMLSQLMEQRSWIGRFLVMLTDWRVIHSFILWHDKIADKFIKPSKDRESGFSLVFHCPPPPAAKSLLWQGDNTVQ